MWLWLLQQLLGAGKCHFFSMSMESGGAVASLWMGLDGPKFLGSFFGGGEITASSAIPAPKIPHPLL